MPSYTTDWQTVSNGEITTLNPQALAPTTDDIRVVSAEIQWEGVSTTSEDRDTKTLTNEFEFGDFSPDSPPTSVDVDVPPVPDGYSHYKHSVIAEFAKDSGEDDYTVDWSGTAPWGSDSGTETVTLNFFFEKAWTTTEFYSVHGGEPASIEVTAIDAPHNTTDVRLRAETTGERTTTSTQQTSAPRVTRDVSAKTSTVLDDGERSAWTPLDGLTAGGEEVYHDIGGSGRARYRVRFDWEYAYPDPTYGTLAVADTDAGVWREVAVTDDPSSSLLAYNHVHVYNDTVDEWGVVDIVDVTDDDAIPALAFYDSDAGWLAPREYQTTPLTGDN